MKAKEGYYRSNNQRIKNKQPRFLTQEQAQKMFDLFGTDAMSFVPGHLDPEAEAEKKAAIEKAKEKQAEERAEKIKRLSEAKEALETKAQTETGLSADEKKELKSIRSQLTKLAKK